MAQKRKNAIQVWAPMPFHLFHMTPKSASMACPPIHVWIPNQPHATIARRMAWTLAPFVPNDARHNTGNETPYFVPACALSVIGIRTMVLPRRIVIIASHQFIPASTKPPASVYVVMTTLIPIHSAAMFQVLQVLSRMVVGARSRFQRGLPETS